MCGIFGYIGNEKKATSMCIQGLERLEYRGYDSSGVAGIDEKGQLLLCKEEGKVKILKESLERSPLELSLAIAQTRWATHGKPSKENAHPHLDSTSSVAVVHNGIIENHHPLREMLKSKGFTFRSETDTEVIAQLVSHFYEGDFLLAVQKALSLMRGFWGIALIHKDHPGQIIAAAKENPMAIALNKSCEEVFVSSDANAFQHNELDVLFLKNNEIAVVKTNQVEVFDQHSVRIQKQTERLDIQDSSLSKNQFEHYMLKEIYDQPESIQQAFHNRFIEDFGTAEFENFTITPQELLSIHRIVILGCGTSWHAGCIAASLLEDIARIPTQAEIASEFRYKNPLIDEKTLAIAISQSGETFDTIAAVREVKAKGAKVIGVCNVRNSTLTREANTCLFLRAGPEISVCSTKAFTSQITVLSLFVLLMARLRHFSKEEGKAFLSEIQNLPHLVSLVLEKNQEIQHLAKKYAHFEHFFFLGRQYMFTASLEGALKLKEISYLNANGYAAGEMKHGPIALINKDLAVIGLCGNMHTYDKMLSNLMEVKARGAPILAFAPEGAPEIAEIAEDVLWLPRVSDYLAGIPYSVASQLLAYHIAKIRGTEIDQPRNLAKSVTVE